MTVSTAISFGAALSIKVGYPQLHLGGTFSSYFDMQINKSQSYTDTHEEKWEIDI